MAVSEDEELSDPIPLLEVFMLVLRLSYIGFHASPITLEGCQLHLGLLWGVSFTGRLCTVIAFHIASASQGRSPYYDMIQEEGRRTL